VHILIYKGTYVFILKKVNIINLNIYDHSLPLVIKLLRFEELEIIYFMFIYIIAQWISLNATLR